MSNPQKNWFSSLPPSDGILHTLYGYRYWSKLDPQINRWLYKTKNRLKSVVPWVLNFDLYAIAIQHLFVSPDTPSMLCWVLLSAAQIAFADDFQLPCLITWGFTYQSLWGIFCIPQTTLQMGCGGYGCRFYCENLAAPMLQLGRNAFVTAVELIFVWVLSFTSAGSISGRGGDMTHTHTQSEGSDLFYGSPARFHPISLPTEWVCHLSENRVPHHGLRKSQVSPVRGYWSPHFLVPNSRHLMRPQTLKLSDRAYSASSLMLSPERCAGRTPQWLRIFVAMSQWGRLLWRFVIEKMSWISQS